MELAPLFSQCLSIPYRRVGVAADYALQKDRGTLFLFFQASNGAEDWKSNLDFPAKPYRRMGVTTWFAHRGFLRVWRELEPELSGAVSDRNVQRVVIVGYSHGGALALLCHEYVWYHRPDLRDRLEGYGFGCPRVFWGLRRKSLRRRWERFFVIRNGNDLVTHLPPLLFGYRHVGTLLRMGVPTDPALIGAHYPQRILLALEEYDTRLPAPSPAPRTYRPRRRLASKKGTSPVTAGDPFWIG